MDDVFLFFLLTWLLTIRMPDLPQKLHLGRTERVVLGEVEFGGKDAALERGVFRSLDQGFPGEDIVFGDGAGGDAVRWGGGEEPVFVE